MSSCAGALSAVARQVPLARRRARTSGRPSAGGVTGSTTIAPYMPFAMCISTGFVPQWYMKTPGSLALKRKVNDSPGIDVDERLVGSDPRRVEVDRVGDGAVVRERHLDRLALPRVHDGPGRAALEAPRRVLDAGRDLDRDVLQHHVHLARRRPGSRGGSAAGIRLVRLRRAPSRSSGAAPAKLCALDRSACPRRGHPGACRPSAVAAEAASPVVVSARSEATSAAATDERCRLRGRRRPSSESLHVLLPPMVVYTTSIGEISGMGHRGQRRSPVRESPDAGLAARRETPLMDGETLQPSSARRPESRPPARRPAVDGAAAARVDELAADARSASEHGPGPPRRARGGGARRRRLASSARGPGRPRRLFAAVPEEAEDEHALLAAALASSLEPLPDGAALAADARAQLGAACSSSGSSRAASPTQAGVRRARRVAAATPGLRARAAGGRRS